MMNNLSIEQKNRIEENKRKALERRQANPKNSNQYGNSSNAFQITPNIKSTSPKTVSSIRNDTSDNKTSTQSLFSPSKVNSFYQKTNANSKSATISKKSRANFEKSFESKPKGYDYQKKSKFNFASKTKVSLFLVSSSRFQAKTGYNPFLIEIFKSIESRSFDQHTKQWTFHLKDYKTLVSKFKDIDDISVEFLPRYVRNTFKNVIDNKISDSPNDTVDLTKIGKNLLDSLLPYQVEGVRFCIQRKGRAMIADDMGLGKTLQALCVTYFYRDEWPLLIVTPSSVKFAWRDQILQWLEDIEPSSINIVSSAKTCDFTSPINILSYDLLGRIKKEIVKEEINVVIFDESHFLKNGKALRSQAAMEIVKNAKRVLLLSGTPALSRPSELFTQISAIDPNLFPYFKIFGERYCDGKQLTFGFDATGSSNLEELQSILEARIMIRRLKTDVLLQLPSKIRQMIILDSGCIQKKKSLLKELSLSESQLQNTQGNEKRGALMEYFVLTANAKLNVVREYISDLLEASNKFLVFCHHQVMLDGLEEFLTSKNVACIRIDGKTNSEQRNVVCKKFQNEPAIQVALLSITAANAGINLCAATLVLFAELYWNPGILIQAEDRAHRIGQKDSVSVRYLVCPGTADDYIWPMIKEKLNVLCKVGIHGNNFKDTETKTIDKSKQNKIVDYLIENLQNDPDDVDLLMSASLCEQNLNSVEIQNSSITELADDAISNTDCMKSNADDTKSNIDDTKSNADDTKSNIDDTKSKADDMKSNTDDTKSKTDDTKSNTDDTKSNADLTSLQFDNCDENFWWSDEDDELLCEEPLNKKMKIDS